MPPDILGTLEVINEAAGYLEADTTGLNFDTFMADRRTRQIVEHNVIILGAAVNRLRRHVPDIAARIGASNQFVELGDEVLHDYDRIDYSIVWFAVQESLPVLQAEVETLLRKAEAS